MSDVRKGRRVRVIRLPLDLDAWLDERATVNGGSVSTEIARECRKLKNADAKDQRAKVSA
jgi:hypothetical protein